MDLQFMREAIRLSREGMESNQGGPFGCVIVKDGQIIGRGNNRVTSTMDPSAHAEIVAIREACRHLNHFQLDNCVVYTSCEPCPMCLGALYWARPAKIYYANTRHDAAAIGFSDQLIYEEVTKDVTKRLIPMEQQLHDEALAVFRMWMTKADKITY
jgi:tRNA(Arg) A34 adenosine deaminase TadA